MLSRVDVLQPVMISETVEYNAMKIINNLLKVPLPIIYSPQIYSSRLMLLNLLLDLRNSVVIYRDITKLRLPMYILIVNV